MKLTELMIGVCLAPGIAAAASQMLVMSGQAAPGATEPFESLGYPVINDAGEVAFPGFLRHTPVRDVSSQNDMGLWTSSSSGVALSAMEDTAAPGAGGAVFRHFGHPHLNADGGMTFYAYVREAGESGPVDNGNDLGVWRSNGGSLELLAREGDDIPDLPGLTYGYLNEPVVRKSGDILMQGTVGGAPSNADFAIFASTGGAVSTLARENDAAPDIPGTAYHSFWNVAMSESGNVAYFASLRGDVNSQNDGALFVGTPGAMNLAVRKGSIAAGTSGALYENIYNARINDQGDLAFMADLQVGGGPRGADLSNDHGIWTRTDGVMNLVAREGSVAPGTGNAVFSGFVSTSVTLNAASDVCFLADLQLDEKNGVTFENYSGLWKTNGLSLDLIARQGDVAPDSDGGVLNAFGKPAMNDRGDVVFDAGILVPGDEGSMHSEGLYAWSDATQALMAIAVIGDLIDVSEARDGSDLREIARIDFGDGPNTKDFDVSTGLNNRGQVAYGLLFSDGSSGVFVATVPTPGGMVVFAATLLGVNRRRR